MQKGAVEVLKLCGFGAQYGKNKFSVRIMIILVLSIGDTKDDSQD